MIPLRPSYHIEVAITHENGKLTLVPTGQKGFAYADLWADINPTLAGDGDYTIDSVYLGSQYDHTVEILTGEIEGTAKELLQADKAWSDLADSEARERFGVAA